jgi:hypothetical protein
MTDEQLYNYELAFNVPRRTFDRPPSSSKTARYGGRLEPEFNPAPPDFRGSYHAEEQVRTSPGAFETTAHAPEPGRYGVSGSTVGTTRTAARVPPQVEEIPEPETTGAADEADDSDEMHELFAEANAWKVEQNPRTSGDLRPLDLSKPVRTITTKQPVEIITTKARHPVYKVHAYIGNDAVVTVFTLDGQLSEHGPRFLENVPEQRELYLNIYLNAGKPGGDRYRITEHETREQADSVAGAGRIACVKAELS